MDVFSFELLAYRQLINPNAMPHAEDKAAQLPDYFICADDINPKQHVDNSDKSWLLLTNIIFVDTIWI